MIVCNAPFVFKMVYNVCKGWVDEKTLKKIQIFRDKDDAYEKMREFIDDDLIPRSLGG